MQISMENLAQTNINSSLVMRMSAFRSVRLKEEEFRKPYLMIVLLCKYDRADRLLFKNVKSWKNNSDVLIFSFKCISNLLSSGFFLLWKKYTKIILMS